MNILFIDTSSNKEVKVGLKGKGRVCWLKKPISPQKAQIILPMIDEILKVNKLNIKDISAVEVATGPGSFTGLRVGVSVANGMGWALGIAVNGKKQAILPSY